MWTAVLLTWDSAGVRTRVSFVSIDIALRCSAEIGLSEWCRLIAPYSKKDRKAGARGTYLYRPRYPLA